jgi:hypothetical protein
LALRTAHGARLDDSAAQRRARAQLFVRGRERDGGGAGVHVEPARALEASRAGSEPRRSRKRPLSAQRP